ncbi:BRO-N domain-containing protein [Xanthobacter variabilis]|uniref:BRO-N domain-containing protein n=1 Tax=Xanthobacter variabilis TaxID=3119932 RepID=UPI00372D38CD
MWTISESGLYRLVNRSDKAQARPFQDWVNREVLPCASKLAAILRLRLRRSDKDGAYIMGAEKSVAGPCTVELAPHVSLVVNMKGCMNVRVAELYCGLRRVQRAGRKGSALSGCCRAGRECAEQEPMAR